MGILILLNDVESILDKEGLIPSNSTAPSDDGIIQSKQIPKYFSEHYPVIDKSYASQSKLVQKLLHNLRLSLRTPNRKVLEIKCTPEMNDRNFGVLTGSRLALFHDLFNHTRVSGEGGESIAQCRERVVNFVNVACDRAKRNLLVSHPFLCQILSNVMLGYNHVTLTRFWFEKGSFMVFESKAANDPSWYFKTASNAISDRHYSVEEVYSDLLGKERDRADQATV